MGFASESQQWLSDTSHNILGSGIPCRSQGRDIHPASAKLNKGSHRSVEGCLMRRQKVLQMQEAYMDPKASCTSI